MSHARSSSHKMRSDRGGFVFQATPAVTASRSRSRYVDCSVCQADRSQYLFHKVGVRFVRCTTCGMVYVNPVSDAGPNWFDIDGLKPFARREDRVLCGSDFEALLQRVAADYERTEGRPPKKVVLMGRYLKEFGDSPTARRVGLVVVEVDDRQFRALCTESKIDWARSPLTPDVDVLLLNEALEACSDAGAVAEQLTRMLPAKAWLAVTYSNGQSFPSMLLRRYWPNFFDFKSAFFNTSNLAALMARFGYVLTSQGPVVEHHTVDYVLDRVIPKRRDATVFGRAMASWVTMPVRAGGHFATFRKRRGSAEAREKLSIIVPCYNEAEYVEAVLEALLAKKLKIEKEVIIVESNSTDGTREIVTKFESHPDVKVILEEKPRGKGHAVRSGLAAATGSILLIQDADFEYDLEDYDALLEPILQRRTAFVLGSRSLGLDDWKVRRFARGHVKGLMLNFAQLVFARTFNVLYQNKTTDINTMFKVFRSECLEGLNLESNRFDLDIELVCKLVRNGNAPLEVPVNYVARGFEEGKKISFLRDAIPSYAAIFKYRFGSGR